MMCLIVFGGKDEKMLARDGHKLNKSKFDYLHFCVKWYNVGRIII